MVIGYLLIFMGHSGTRQVVGSDFDIVIGAGVKFDGGFEKLVLTAIDQRNMV